jgi:hypothetical protein
MEAIGGQLLFDFETAELGAVSRRQTTRSGVAAAEAGGTVVPAGLALESADIP